MPLLEKHLMPKVSVIVPVYNVEQYLPDCLNSILTQTYKDFEVFCVNDGSPDKCGEILAEYARKDKRIKVVSQKNQGVSATRNNALQQAKGEYICFVDSDDELAPNFLEKMLDVLVQHNADIVSCDIQQGEEKQPWVKQDKKIRIHSNPFENYMQGQLKTYTAVWGKLYKKDALKGLEFNQEISQSGEDILYLYQVLYQAKKLATTSQQLYFYRVRPNSVVTSKLSERFALGNIKTAKFLLDYFKNKELSQKTRKILNQKIAKRIFKFAVLEPKRKDKENLDKWYDLTRPLLAKLKQKGIYQPKYLTLKNQLKSWFFLKGKK